MRVNLRHKKVLELLKSHGQLGNAMLLDALGCSEATLRRDLAALEHAGKVVRMFGGAKLPETASLVERTFEHKRRQCSRQKETIAKIAAQMVEPGMTVALDSGTTIWRIAAAIKDKGPLIVLTNALAAVEELGPVEGVQLHLAGGVFAIENLDFRGPSVVEMFQQAHVDIAFIAADSFIPGKGAFSVSESTAAVAHAMAACADKVVLVLDHTKIYARGHRQILPVDGIDCLITDSGVSSEDRAIMENEPYKLLIATMADVEENNEEISE